MITFTTDKFSGPLGLLLDLIQNEKLDITEVSLAKIADEYLKYIRKLSDSDIDPEELADFLVLAAKLLYIKSKALLPYLSKGEEDEELTELTEQLKIYQEFREASLELKKIIAKGNYLFLPPLNKSRRQFSEEKIFSPPAKLNDSLLQEKFLEIIQRLEKRQEEKLPEKSLEPKINIEEKILELRKELSKKIRINFSKILAKSESKTEVVVSFLALLELIKQRELIFEQDDLFSEISILSHFN